MAGRGHLSEHFRGATAPAAPMHLPPMGFRQQLRQEVSKQKDMTEWGVIVVCNKRACMVTTPLGLVPRLSFSEGRREPCNIGGSNR